MWTFSTTNMNKKLHIPDSQKNLHISINSLFIQNVSTGNKLLEITCVKKCDKNKFIFVLPYLHCSQLGWKTKFKCDFHIDYSTYTSPLKWNSVLIRQNYWKHILTYACLVYVFRWPCHWKWFHMYYFPFLKQKILKCTQFITAVLINMHMMTKKMLKFTCSFDFLIFNKLPEKKSMWKQEAKWHQFYCLFG